MLRARPWWRRLIDKLRTDGTTQRIQWTLKKYIIEDEGLLERLDQNNSKHQPHALSSITPVQFENLVARLYEAIGYSVIKVPHYPGVEDKGCDLILNRRSPERASVLPDRQIVVLAKVCIKYLSYPVIEEALRAVDLYRALECEEARVVTNSYFTQEAIQYAKVNNVGLVEGEQRREMLSRNLGENWG